MEGTGFAFGLGCLVGIALGILALVPLGQAIEATKNPADIPCGHLYRDDSCVEKGGVWRCVWQDESQVTHVVVCQEVE